MATVDQIITEVLRELSSAGGRGVQIHAQDRLGYRVNRTYRMLFTKFWWDEHFKSKILTLDGSGLLSSDMKVEITRMKDIHSVYYGKETAPLGWLPKGQNIANVRNRGLYPSGNDRAIFSVLPLDATGTVTINYRTYPIKDFDLDDEVPLDKDLLILAVASWYATSDALNDALAQRLTAEYTDQLNTLTKNEIRSSYNYAGPTVDVMHDWHVL